MLEAKYSRKDELDRLLSDTESPPDEELWAAPLAQKNLGATVELPGSKSLIARELVLSALADSKSTILQPLHSRDSVLMVEALRALGSEISVTDEAIEIQPARELIGSTSIACGLAGTVMRFVPPLAALALGPTSFDGDVYARKRPMAALLDALRSLGVEIADDGSNTLPFTVHGTGSVEGGLVEVDASSSSQFVSALLLAAPRFKNGVHVRHTGSSLPSVPHIEMTLKTLADRGVEVASPTRGEWVVKPGPIAGREVTLEPDLSNAAPFLAAALVAGGSVIVPNWPTETTQVGDQLRHLLPEFGAEVLLEGGSLTVTGGEKINSVNLHIPYAGELAPTLIGLAAFADGPSTITGIGHIRHHETDRIAGLIAELKKIGCEARELEDGIEVVPSDNYSGADWNSYDDHRMATTGALVGLRVPDVRVINIGSTSKTMPKFTQMWHEMLADKPTLSEV